MSCVCPDTGPVALLLRALVRSASSSSIRSTIAYVLIAAAEGSRLDPFLHQGAIVWFHPQLLVSRDCGEHFLHSCFRCELAGISLPDAFADVIHLPLIVRHRSTILPVFFPGNKELVSDQHQELVAELRSLLERMSRATPEERVMGDN
jgi:hypothetical protein